MAQQICHETLLDGLILIFQDFKALKFCQNFMLPSSVVINRVLSTYYRASTTFSYYKKIIKIGFGYHNGMPLDVAVAYRKPASLNHANEYFDSADSGVSEDEENGRTEVEHGQLQGLNEFSIIRECFIRAINHSANEIKCWQHKCCKLYEDILKRKGCLCHSTRYIEARNDAATKFGNTFLPHFKTLLRQRLGKRLDVVFTVRDVGQNVPYSTARLLLQRYDLKYVKELLFHCSRDYWIQNNALFWDSNYLKSRYQSPKSEYYPGLLKGHGNFYYEYKHNANSEVEVKLRKYYTQLFKEVHQNDLKNVSPFSKPMLKHYLCEKFNLTKNINYTEWIECVENTLNLYNSKTFMYCREELICSSLRPRNSRIENILNSMKKSCEGSSKCFKAIKITDILNYLNGFIKPLLGCIKTELIRKALMDEEEAFYYVTDDQLRLLCACEAVIGFAVYGTTISRNQREMFPKEIRDELGLLIKYFKNLDSNKRTWKDICVGLNGIKNIKITPRNKVVCTAKFELHRMHSLYLSEDSRKILYDYFSKCNDLEMHPLITDGVSGMIIDILVEFSFHESSSTTIQDYNWKHLRDTSLRTYSVTPVTSQEYCDWLFKNQNCYYNDILQILHQCKSVFPAVLSSNIEQSFVNKLDVKIREKGYMLLAPKEKHSKFAIFPISLPLSTIRSKNRLYYSHVFFVLSNLKVFFESTLSGLFSEQKLEAFILGKFEHILQQIENVTLEQIFDFIKEEIQI